MIETALVLPCPPALLAPRSVADPVADLRRACKEAVERLPRGRRTVVVAAPVDATGVSRGVTEPLGHRVAAELLPGREPARFDRALAQPGTAERLARSPEPTTLVVMADGSARRGEKAPGHLHPDAVGFDAAIEEALRSGDDGALAALDERLGEELWCQGVPGLRVLGEVAHGRRVRAQLLHAEATYGVAWWVARWDLGD